jgi:glycosyltransferase involved in cell wall biosynthesis
VHSEYSKNTLAKKFDIPSDKIVVIPHGNYLFFRTGEMSQKQARQTLHIPQDKKIILHFGALRAYKGIDTLLEAFKKLKEKHQDVFLLLVGKPMYIELEQLKAMVRQFNLEGDVLIQAEYIPFQNIGSYFFACDAVVFPYKAIDISGSLQLAYAFAKPVIATQTGGLPEVVSDAENGILVPPNDNTALFESFERILWDDNRLKQMGQMSFQMAKEKFSWDKIASQTNTVYQEVLGA